MLSKKDHGLLVMIFQAIIKHKILAWSCDISVGHVKLLNPNQDTVYFNEIRPIGCKKADQD